MGFWGKFDQTAPAARSGGKVMEERAGGKRKVVRDGRWAGRGDSQATPFAAQRLQIREARKNFLCAAQKPCRLRVFATARAALLG